MFTRDEFDAARGDSRDELKTRHAKQPPSARCDAGMEIGGGLGGW